MGIGRSWSVMSQLFGHSVCWLAAVRAPAPMMLWRVHGCRIHGMDVEVTYGIRPLVPHADSCSMHTSYGMQTSTLYGARLHNTHRCQSRSYLQSVQSLPVE
jgi:hypothetical protein